MTMKPLKRALASICCCLLAWAVSGAFAAGVELTADMGYDGVVTYLRRLPVRVQVTNQGGDATGTLAIDVNRDERNFDRYSMALSVPSGATVNAVLPISLSTKQDVYKVQWLVDDEAQTQVTLAPQRVLNPETLIVGVLSDQPQNLNWMTVTAGSDVLKRGELWQTAALTVDTFPQDQNGLGFFDVLAVDGMDLNLLSDAQRGALDGWLREGGVVLVGGGAQAATAFPYFNAYTGITAGSLTQSETLSDEILAQFGLSGKNLGQAAAVTALGEADKPGGGETPLYALTAVDEGLIVTMSFSLSDKPLNSWLGGIAFVQRVLLRDAPEQYTDMVSSRSDGRYRNYRYVDYETVNQIPVPNQSGMVLPLVILVVFVGLAGFGGYFILRAMDKREWMWVTVPVLCVASALLIWGVSSMLNLRSPIAVSYTVVKQDADGTRDGFTGLGVACAQEGRVAVSLEQGTLNLDQQNDYFYNQEETGTVPVRTLRYETALDGGQEALSFDQKVTWEQNTFVTAGVPLTDCRVSGKAGWEGQKLVFTLENQGTIPLSDGVIVTDYGFVSVPALLPGQTATAEMIPHQGNIESSSDIGDGMLLNDTERRMFGFYEYIERYRAVKKGSVEHQELLSRFLMIQNFANSDDWYNGLGDPRYVAFSDQLADLKVSMNGAPVTRTGQQGMLCVCLSFDPVSKDGAVRFLAGSIPVYPGEADSRGVPRKTASTGKSRGYVSYRLSDSPIFAYDLNALPQGSVLTRLDVAPRNVYFGYQAEAYSFREEAWVAVKTWNYDQRTGQGSEKLTLPKVADCLDNAGMMYVRFSAYGNVEDYADMTLPDMTIDGRLE